MIQTILFDVDGVLVRGQMASRYFEEKYGIDHKMTVKFYRGSFSDCLLGNKDVYEVLPPFLEKWGWQKTPKDFMQEWLDFENQVDGVLVELIQRLRRYGAKCYLATNQEKLRAQYLLDHMGFGENFDGMFASACLGSKKPDSEFFEKVLNTLSIVDKTSVLFWDDEQKNVDAAQEFGICAEQFVDVADFRAKLQEKYGIKI
jgi:putative hydrolase of the HAD superfamily